MKNLQKKLLRNYVRNMEKEKPSICVGLAAAAWNQLLSL